mgnify:CR=1 FL=1
MNIRKKLLSVLAAAATLAASAAGALTLTAGAAEGVYDGAKVVWEGSLSVNSTSFKGVYGNDNARVSLDLSGKKYLLFTVENPTGVEADLFNLNFQFTPGGYRLMPKLDGKFEVLADGAAAWKESTVHEVSMDYAGLPKCLTVPAGNSVVRIPLDGSVLSGGRAADDSYVLDKIDFVDCYVRAAGAGENKTVTLKKFAVTDTDFVPKVEPQGSTVLSTGKSGKHKIQGIGAGFVPDTLDGTVYDEIIAVSDDEAFEKARLLAKKEALSVGISSGAALAAAIEVAKREENAGKTVVVLLPDSGDRYYSTALFSE